MVVNIGLEDSLLNILRDIVPDIDCVREHEEHMLIWVHFTHLKGKHQGRSQIEIDIIILKCDIKSSLTYPSFTTIINKSNLGA